MTTKQTIKNIRISAEILKLVLAGQDVRQAFNVVIGEGAYEKLAGDIYDELKARSANNNK